MIITLKTPKTSLNNLMEVTFIGPLLLFLLAMAPVPLLFITNALVPFAEDSFIERINTLIAAFWNMLLAFGFRITIGIFFIPCWLLFLVIGVYRYFYP